MSVCLCVSESPSHDRVGLAAASTINEGVEAAEEEGRGEGKGKKVEEEEEEEDLVTNNEGI